MSERQLAGLTDLCQQLEDGNYVPVGTERQKALTVLLLGGSAVPSSQLPCTWWSGELDPAGLPCV